MQCAVTVGADAIVKCLKVCLVFVLRLTFYLLRKYDAYSILMSLKPSTFVGGKKIRYIWLSMQASHLILWIQITSFFTKQLLPSNQWREQLLPEQLITPNLWYRSIMSLHVHHAYLNIAQNMWVYSTLTRWMGRWVFFNSVWVRWRRDYAELFWIFVDFLYVVFFSDI